MMNLTQTNTRWTSDTHYYHKNILNICNRPFKSTDEMHHTLIQNWNSTTGDDDFVFILGDFSFGSLGATIEILEQLNGNKILVEGNHDTLFKKNPELKQYFLKSTSYFEAQIPDDDTNRGTQKLCMSHYPHMDWNGSYHGSWMLHGHLHSRNFQYPFDGKILDVGVDNHEFRPWTYTEIKQHMSTTLKKGARYHD